MKENRMGTQKTSSLMLSMAFPVMLSTAVQSLYNIVDGIFVSRISENAMAAITFANPVVTVLIAIGSGIAVGMNTLLSHALGEKNSEKVSHAATISIWLIIVFGCLSFLTGWLFPGFYMRLQTDNVEIVEAGTAYLTTYLCMGISTMAQLVFERMLISTGKTKLSMISQTTGGVFNLMLDPILIFGHFGFPAMGISGAAIATICSQTVAAVIALILNVKYNREVRLRVICKVPAKTIRRLLLLGTPTAVILSLNSFMMINYNAVLNQFSSTAVAVFGACCRVTGFCYALLNAMCSAAIPVIAFNHGAGKKKRIDEAIRYGYIYSFILMLVGTIVCVGFPEVFLRMFNATDEMIEIGVWGMRMLCCCYLLVAVRNMSNCILQALGHSVVSMAIDLSRNYAILIPFAWLFSLSGSLELVWVSVPIADIVSALVGFLLMLCFYRRDIKVLQVEVQMEE